MISKGDSWEKELGEALRFAFARLTTERRLFTHAIPSPCSTEEGVDFQCVKGFVPGVPWVISYVHISPLFGVSPRHVFLERQRDRSPPEVAPTQIPLLKSLFLASLAFYLILLYQVLSCFGDKHSLGLPKTDILLFEELFVSLAERNLLQGSAESQDGWRSKTYRLLWAYKILVARGGEIA